MAAMAVQALRRLIVSAVFIGIALTNFHHELQRQQTLSSRRESPTPSSPYLTVVDENDDGYEIVTTNYGWTTEARADFPQRKVSGEFFDAVLSHRRYNSTAWTDLENSPDPNQPIVAFMDIDTCIEGNYPEYARSFHENSNIRGKPNHAFHYILHQSCGYIQKAAESPALKASKDSRLVLLDCGNGPWYNIKDVCSAKEIGDGPWSVLNNSQVIIAYYGIAKSYARSIDIGLPPPAIKPIVLRPHERLWLDTCKKRNYLFSFQGRGGFLRDQLVNLDNGEDVYVKMKDSSTYWGRVHDVNVTSMNMYEDILRESAFGGAPRGDCLWSYRFTEVMSAGAVPVVYANDWLPPFESPADTGRVVNWTKCGVFIGELNWQKAQTVDQLRAISDDVRCEMQKCSLAFWDEFASSREGWLRGILSWIRASRD